MQASQDQHQDFECSSFEQHQDESPANEIMISITPAETSHGNQQRRSARVEAQKQHVDPDVDLGFGVQQEMPPKTDKFSN